jgi:hypothetical protein
MKAIVKFSIYTWFVFLYNVVRSLVRLVNVKIHHLIHYKPDYMMVLAASKHYLHHELENASLVLVHLYH